jgi:RNA polymerase sigma-70 factor, ECF subfamily
VDQDDSALIERCRAGDVAAFEPLVEKYRERVWRVAYQTVRDREEAWDVAQEAFIRAYQSLGSFRGQSAFYTWLFRIVVNLATDRVRQRAARGRAFGTEPVPEEDWERAMPDEVTAGPDEESARREERRRIAQALEALPENFRTIIVLSDVEGLSYREIAQVLEIPMGTVMSRLHNARKRLRQILKPLVILALVLPWLVAGPAQAQWLWPSPSPQVVRFGARVLLASDVAIPGAEPAPLDERLANFLPKLEAIFRYKRYTSVGRYRAEVPLGTAQRWEVPGDRHLEVVPERVVSAAVRMRLRLVQGTMTELDANIQPQPGQPAVIGGLPHGDGVLIIIIWANPHPR